MKRMIDPKSLGLAASVRIEQTSVSKLALIIDRKSRIIMKDGKAILEKVGKIKAHFPKASVAFKTSAPVCSKTKAFLAQHHIVVIPLR